MPWIQTVSAEAAEGDLATFYGLLGIDSGVVGPPFEVGTLNGPALLRLTQLDTAVRFKASELSRLHLEMIAGYVSALNHCVF